VPMRPKGFWRVYSTKDSPRNGYPKTSSSLPIKRALSEYIPQPPLVETNPARFGVDMSAKVLSLVNRHGS